MNRKHFSYKLLFIASVCLFIGMAIGFTIGATKTLDYCIDVGIKILEVNGYELNIKKSVIWEAMGTYKAHFDRDLFKVTP